GPADKDGQIKIGDRLLEVDGISLCGLTHKQAVENLKKSGQIAKLVLERGHHQAAEPCLSTNDRKEDQGAVVSVATSFTDGSKDYSFLTDDNTFEVKLTKNSGGLGFSVLQMEEDGYEHLGGAIVRIKRLFPGQPAEENGEIEVGDIILAVNGKPLQGLLYQDVLHLLRGAPSQVTLLLCRPPKGVLPEIEQSALTPAPSPVKAFMAEMLGSPEAGNSLDPSTSDGGSTSQDLEDCLDSPLAADFSEPPEEESSTYEEQEAESQENPIQRLMPPRETSSYTLLDIPDTGIQKMIHSTLTIYHSQLIKDMEENPSTMIFLFSSPVFIKSDGDLSNRNCMSEILSLTPIDEEYFTISSTSVTSLSRGGSSETLSTTLVTPQPRVCGPFSSSLPARDTQNSDNEWEDLEELEEEKEEIEDCTREMEIFVTLTRSENNGYGFSVVLNKVDNCLYVDEILHEPALSDGRLRRGDRIIMVNGIDVTSLQCNEALSLLQSSPPDLRLVVGRAGSDPCPSVRPDDIPEITLTKGANGQLGLKLTGGAGSKLQGIYVLEIVPGSPASVEGSLQPRDQILYICGLWTEGISLDDAVRVCEAATQNVQIKATRNGNPVVPIEQENSNISVNDLKKNVQLFTERNKMYNHFTLQLLLKELVEIRVHCFHFTQSVFTLKEESNWMCSKVKFELGFFLYKSSVPLDKIISCSSEVIVIIENSCSRKLKVTENRLKTKHLYDPDEHNFSHFHKITPLMLFYRSQKNTGYEGCRRESQLSESDNWNNEDDDMSHRTSILPRSRTFVSEDELTHLINFKSSPTGVRPRTGIRYFIQGLKSRIENQEVLKEFMALEHLKPIDDCRTGKAPENRDKNRYQDILPYDKTRVPLGESNSYINASYIRMKVGEEEHFYIITQGPLPSTMADFWQMVWESESDLIAMMTKEVELGNVKSHRYWPEPPQDSIDLANFHLRLDSYQILEYFIIRIIEMINKQTDERRIISHLQFTAWPDHSTAKLSEQLVKFICYMRKAHRRGPVVAHCSAGIGRSGVLLCVEILLSYIEKDLCFDIKHIVRDLREQRFGMIQNKDQYLFCYEFVLQVLQNLQAADSY
ncbi:PTN20 phosphatase, partial [Odontophorus gujanensis]|nr:PTN20 phosphatase [Odontophorus gujanensis]